MDSISRGRRSQNWLPFEEAREFARSLHLDRKEDWFGFVKSDRRPRDIPYSPAQIYRSQWQGWGDWLGTFRIANRCREFLPFEEARAFVRTLKIKSHRAWRPYSVSGKRPSNIPSHPNEHYGEQFQGWGDWLGTNNVATHFQEFLPFEEARAFVHILKIKNEKKWNAYSVSGKRPSNIPGNPRFTYGEQFLGMGDWLGTGKIATYDSQYVPKLSENERRLRNKHSHLRRSHQRAVSGTYTPAQIQEQLKRQKHRCYYAACGYAKFKKRDGEYVFQVDHTFPLSRVSGTDIPANDMGYLVLACASCNAKKKDKFPWEWFEGGRLL